MVIAAESEQPAGVVLVYDRQQVDEFELLGDEEAKETERVFYEGDDNILHVSVSRVHPGSPSVVASSARARPDARVDASRARRAARARTTSSSSRATATASTSASPASIRDPHPSSPRPRARPDARVDASRTRRGATARTRSTSPMATTTSSTL